jgi:hypothetical protein
MHWKLRDVFCALSPEHDALTLSPLNRRGRDVGELVGNFTSCRLSDGLAGLSDCIVFTVPVELSLCSVVAWRVAARELLHVRLYHGPNNTYGHQIDTEGRTTVCRKSSLFVMLFNLCHMMSVVNARHAITGHGNDRNHIR